MNFPSCNGRLVLSETSTQHHLVQLLRDQHDDQSLSDNDLVRKLRDFFNVDPDTEGYFQVTFASGLHEFERSKPGNKVMHHLDVKS